MADYRPVSTSPRGSTSEHGSPASIRQLELSEAFPDDVTDRPGLVRHHRSSTITSLGGFDFQSDLLPLTPSGQVDDGSGEGGGHKGDERHVGMLQGGSEVKTWRDTAYQCDMQIGMALIIGTQVGSGIFSSPGVVTAEVGSVGASLLVWVMSALLAWTGAR
jgi:hypothetical protein